MTRTCKNSIDGVALLKSIDDKNDLKKAKDSLTLFAAYFEDKIRTFAEVQASHLGLTEAAAFHALQCAFVKVWKYPYSFDMNKSNCSNEETAIIVWLKSIVASQLLEYAEKGTCVSQTEEEDLSVIENTRSFVEYHMPDIQPDEKTK